MISQYCLVIFQMEEELHGAVYRNGAYSRNMTRYSCVPCANSSSTCVAVKQLLAELAAMYMKGCDEFQKYVEENRLQIEKYYNNLYKTQNKAKKSRV